LRPDANLRLSGNRFRNPLRQQTFDLVEIPIREAIKATKTRSRIGPKLITGGKLAGPRTIERMAASRAWSRSSRSGTGSGRSHLIGRAPLVDDQ